jgi:hypothetical protein
VTPFSSQRKISEVNKALDVSKEQDTEETIVEQKH